MPIRDTIQTSTLSLGELFTNGRSFRVPRFQRDYSWGLSEWEDLWADVLETEREDRDHYLGAVVLQACGGKHFEVIDGQQRLATLTILALALIAQFGAWGVGQGESVSNARRAELFRERLVSPLDPKSLKSSSRLALNANDDDFFQSYIVNGGTPTRPSRLKGSESALWEAMEFFRARVAERFGDSDGESLAGFVEDVFSQRLIFIEIVVDDEAAAYTVFETLNGSS